MNKPEMTSEAKQKLNNLVSNIEQIYLENISLKCLLSARCREDGKLILPNWESELRDLMSLPESQKAISEQFSPLRRALSEAVDEHAVFVALLQLKPTGRVQ